MIAVDTNLLVYIMLPCKFTNLVEKVYERDSEWIAPQLWRYEFRNVLLRYIRMRKITLYEAVTLADKAEKLMRNREFITHPERTLTLAEQSGCTSYDCEFIAISEEMEVPLLTFDKQVLKAFNKKAVHPENFIN